MKTKIKPLLTIQTDGNFCDDLCEYLNAYPNWVSCDLFEASANINLVSPISDPNKYIRCRKCRMAERSYKSCNKIKKF